MNKDQKKLIYVEKMLDDCEWCLSFLNNCIQDTNEVQYQYKNGANRVRKTLQRVQRYKAKTAVNKNMPE